MSASTPDGIDRADIQGNILEGYRFPNGAYLFFELPGADAGQAFLGALQPLIQTAERWDANAKPATVTNVAVTYAGLQILGVSQGLLEQMPPEFCEPIRKRASRLLGDRGPSAPEHWDEHVGTEHSHVAVSIFGEAGSHGFVAAVGAVTDAAGVNGVTLLVRQDTTQLEGRREHFGWADGFGQPAVEGVDESPVGGNYANGKWSPVKLGEFLHGYPDEDGEQSTGAVGDLLRDGTFMVWRKLHQDIVGFRAHLYGQAQAYGTTQPGPAQDPDHLYEVLAAKVVGRWRDGTAIELAPERPDVTNLGSVAGDQPPDNDFHYAPADRNGEVCPLGAHIRRTNPRDALGPAGSLGMARRHRIIRRGTPYGPFLPFAEGQQDDGQDRGLIFVCWNASIARQFEVVQQQWCNDGNVFGLGDERDHLLVNATPGPDQDPPVGAPAATASMSVQGDPPFFVAPAPSPFVVTKGCEYLFMPGLRALSRLATGGWSDTATSATATSVSATSDSVDPGENQAIERIVASARATLQADYPPSVRPVRREQHAKAHGLVRAELHVRSDVPADLRHGLFAAPATYAAWVRFSSSQSGPALATDAKPDAHGMAIKVLGVPGLKVLTRERDALTQDFLLANSPVFFVRNPADYLDLVNDKDQGHFLRFFVGVDPRRWHPRELLNVLKATRKVIGNPLDCLYWSQTPYALGPLEVKYAARPTTGHPDPVVRSGGPDGLAATMADQLRSGPWSFDLMVQCRTDDARMPVEDPTVRWSERRSPFVTVATVVMEPQDLSAPERAALAENLAFTPWHSLPAHRPLGGINRVRRAVYEAVSDARRQLNGVDPVAEPTE